MDLGDAVWHKSSYSGNETEYCVEVAQVEAATAVRDSKDPHGPALVLSRQSWRRFLDHLKQEGC